MPGRRYSDGLHQAIEAKEHVNVRRESRTLATITFQNFFNKFAKTFVVLMVSKASQMPSKAYFLRVLCSSVLSIISMLGRVAALLIRDLDRSRVIFLALARGQ